MQQTKQNGHCQNLQILLSNPLYEYPAICINLLMNVGLFQDFTLIRHAAVKLRESFKKFDISYKIKYVFNI